MRKKILFLTILLMIIKTNVCALTYGGCDYSSISRLRSLISNVNISYDYHIRDNKAYFDVTLNNIPKGIYFIDNNTNKQYFYSNSNNGEITIKDQVETSGTYKFFSSLSECKDIYLGAKYYKLPAYNTYYGDKLCSDIPEYSLCQKWASVGYSQEQFEKKVNEYKKSDKPIEEDKPIVIYEKNLLDKIIDLYAKYYYLFLLIIILICGIIILIKNKKDSFDL